MKRPESSLRRTIRRLGAREQGMANDEVHGATIRQVARIVQHLIAEGAFHKARINGKNVRYFARQDCAEAWLDAAKLAHRSFVKAKAERALPELDEDVAPWPADAPINYPPGYRHTICPPSMLGLHQTNTHRDTH